MIDPLSHAARLIRRGDPLESFVRSLDETSAQALFDVLVRRLGVPEPLPGECPLCRHPWSEHDQRSCGEPSAGCLRGWDGGDVQGCWCLRVPPSAPRA